ncbi:protein of unknown function [Microbacterium sp. Nx66]|nr:protein of unknown function [Microbacterium sp. Nx66]
MASGALSVPLRCAPLRPEPPGAGVVHSAVDLVGAADGLAASTRDQNGSAEWQIGCVFEPAREVTGLAGSERGRGRRVEVRF